MYEHATNAGMRKAMHSFVEQVQAEICQALTQLDGHAFLEECWERPEGGGGRTRVLQDGSVFEKAGVNVSEVYGTLTADAIASMGGGTDIKDPRFYATGISLVLHPHNPFAPTVHANYRYFERGEAGSPDAWWFGGGADLTPSYLFEEDTKHFHLVHKQACDKHDPQLFPRFKRWCDEYFRITHRDESRGIGGIFFDNLHDRSVEKLFAFVQTCARSFLPAYLPIVERRKDTPFSPAHKEWQQLRRGRYVEFNLVYDRGTKFGLHSGGRTESILMSLPKTASWYYGHTPKAQSEEAKLLEVLKHPRDWV